MQYCFLFLVAALATTVGAITGMGGVIIKPVLDATTELDAMTVSILSSSTVFTMSVVNIIQHLRKKTPFPYRVALPIAACALIGGSFGQLLLEHMFSTSSDTHTVTLIQNVLLFLLLILTLLYTFKKDNIPTLFLKGAVPAGLTGLVLGLLASFLGIGGGPFNVAVLMLLFSVNIKEAAVCSILTILFSQGAKLIHVLVKGEFPAISPASLIIMLCGAVLGGWLGTSLQRRLTPHSVERCYLCVQILMLALTCNIINNFLCF